MSWPNDHRRENWVNSLLLRALVLSLAVHVLLFITIESGRKLGLWKATFRLPNRAIAKRPPAPREIEIEIQRPQPKAPTKEPMTFVEVPPKLAASEPPPDAKFYSAQNSRAANPDTSTDSNTPKFTGTQERVPKVADTPRVKEIPRPAQPVQEKPPEPIEQLAPLVVAPAPPVPKPVDKPVEKPVEKRAEPAPPEKGEVLLAKAMEKPVEPPRQKPPAEIKPQPKPRPRRLAALPPAPNESAIVGEKIKQAGGVRRFGVESSLDVRSTEFGAYDAAIIAAIQKRWYDLLDEHTVSRSQVGKVVLEFRLRSDGRITNLNLRENEVSEILGLMCWRAVDDPQPYAAWPNDLRRLVGKDYREVRFVFYYN